MRVGIIGSGEVAQSLAAGFLKHAETAKASCPVSKALAGSKITLNVKTN